MTSESQQPLVPVGHSAAKWNQPRLTHLLRRLSGRDHVNVLQQFGSGVGDIVF